MIGVKCTGRLCKLAVVLASFSILASGCGKEHEEVVSVYETENYNTSLYEGDLFASDLCVASTDVALEDAPDTSGLYAAALFDVNNKNTDFAYKVHERLYPASTTKIMTALVAIKNADLSDVVTVSSAADAKNFAADESTCGIQAGDQMTLSDLLYGLLLQSGNDNAVAIAEYVGGSVENFVQMMNDEAQNLMATNTHFVNSNGLHNENHYTTAYDLYLIFNECIKHDEFIQMIQADSYTANITAADGTVRHDTWKPTNFYATGEAALPKNATIVGGKTGTTSLAGNCLILLEKDSSDNPYISIVMGADTKALLYQDMTALINEIPANE